MQILTKLQERLLKEAVDACEAWRGTLIGNPDPEPLEDFDAEIKIMREAMGNILRQQKYLRKLRASSRKFKAKTVYCYIGPEDGGCVDIGSFDLS